MATEEDGTTHIEFMSPLGPGDSNGGDENPVREAELIRTKAEELVKQAIAANPPLESRLKYLADRHNGSMKGLEFNIKPVNSLCRKMQQMKHPKMSFEELVDSQYDVLRYTMMLPINKYIVGVQKVMKELVELEHCKEVAIKNYWDCLTYRGINTIFSLPSGMKFELQFHTPETFDQKHNRTHILYEALRTEEEPIKQNVFFLDMISMWDNVTIPEGALSVGQCKRQELPARKEVTASQQECIDRAWALKESMRSQITSLRQRMKKLDPYIISCVEYAGKWYQFNMKEVDTRFKGALRIRRKVEEELRKKAKLPIHKGLHEMELPKVVDGKSFDHYLQGLVNKQADALMYRLVANSEDAYAQSVTGFLELMVRNGFILRSVENYWGDMEKHHAINATFEVVSDHRNLLHPLAERFAPTNEIFFRVEFHTLSTYNCMVERRTALLHIEEGMYHQGEAYNKAAADMIVRYDAVMLRHWADCLIPSGAKIIGTLCPSVTEAVECEEVHRWLTPEQRRIRNIHMVAVPSVFCLGVALGLFCRRSLGSLSFSSLLPGLIGSQVNL